MNVRSSTRKGNEIQSSAHPPTHKAPLDPDADCAEGDVP